MLLSKSDVREKLGEYFIRNGCGHWLTETSEIVTARESQKKKMYMINMDKALRMIADEKFLPI